MDIKKIQVATFAVKNKILGYQLLKNPKGSSPYQVKMIKKCKFTNYNSDKHDFYQTKSRNFSKPDERTEKQTLLVDRLMFWKDKKIVKEATYCNKKSNGEFVATEKKSELPVDEITNRDTSYINKKHTNGYYKEMIPFCFIPIECTLPNIELINDREIYEFFRQKTKKNKLPSFWSVLKQNLNQ